MAIDRDRLEQEAMKLLRKGQNDKALERYQALLKHDPRDRRIRQRVAELYLKLGRGVEAERHFRELVRQLVGAGQEKAAIGVYKQLVRLRPDDAELIGALGDCYLATGFPKDAIAAFQKGAEMLERVYPAEAVPYIKKLIRLHPGDLPLRIRLAELYEAANWSEAAFNEWVALADEARRLGRLDDRARFLAQALRLRADSVEVMLDSAEVELELRRPKGALSLIHKVYAANPRSARALHLLAATFESVGQRAKARSVWQEAARIHAHNDDPLGRADALERALACGADDPTLASELDAARVVAQRVRMRLDQQPWAQPVDDPQIRVVVRAGVLRRYGFPERGRELLEEQQGQLRASASVRAALVELLVGMGQTDAAIGELSSMRFGSAQAMRDIADRLAVLQGRGPQAAQQAADDLDELADIVDDESDDYDLSADDSYEDDLDDGLGEDLLGGESTDGLSASDGLTGADGLDLDELVGDEDTAPGQPSGPEADGDRLAASGDREGAIAAYRAALAADPSSESALMKLGELLSSTPSSAAPRAPLSEPLDLGAPFDPTPKSSTGFNGAGFNGAGFNEGDAFSDDLGALFGDPPPPAPRSSAPVSGPLQDGWAWLAVGQVDRALRVARAGSGLGASLLEAQALRAQGDLTQAASVLRLAVSDAAETDPSYLGALCEMAAIHAATGKLRAASRLLDEVEDIDPDYDPACVRATRRGLELLRQGA